MTFLLMLLAAAIISAPSLIWAFYKMTAGLPEPTKDNFAIDLIGIVLAVILVPISIWAFLGAGVLAAVFTVFTREFVYAAFFENQDDND